VPYLKRRHRDNLKRHVMETVIVAFLAVGFQVKYLFQILLSCDFHGVFSCIFISKQVWNATFSEELSFFMSSFIETEPFLAIVPCVSKGCRI
jgi:hypothetical protein